MFSSTSRFAVGDGPRRPSGAAARPMALPTFDLPGAVPRAAVPRAAVPRESELSFGFGFGEGEGEGDAALDPAAGWGDEYFSFDDEAAQAERRATAVRAGPRATMTHAWDGDLFHSSSYFNSHMGETRESASAAPAAAPLSAAGLAALNAAAPPQKLRGLPEFDAGSDMSVEVNSARSDQDPAREARPPMTPVHRRAPVPVVAPPTVFERPGRAMAPPCTACSRTAEIFVAQTGFCATHLDEQLLNNPQSPMFGLSARAVAVAVEVLRACVNYDAEKMAVPRAEALPAFLAGLQAQVGGGAGRTGRRMSLVTEQRATSFFDRFGFLEPDMTEVQLLTKMAAFLTATGASLATLMHTPPPPASASAPQRSAQRKKPPTPTQKPATPTPARSAHRAKPATPVGPAIVVSPLSRRQLPRPPGPPPNPTPRLVAWENGDPEALGGHDDAHVNSELGSQHFPPAPPRRSGLRSLLAYLCCCCCCNGGGNRADAIQDNDDFFNRRPQFRYGSYASRARVGHSPLGADFPSFAPTFSSSASAPRGVATLRPDGRISVSFARDTAPSPSSVRFNGSPGRGAARPSAVSVASSTGDPEATLAARIGQATLPKEFGEPARRDTWVMY